MSIVNIRGVDHYYEWIARPTGSKPVIVFVHGWGGSSRYWRSTGWALRDRFDYLLYDLRGFGRSSLPGGTFPLGYELEEYAEDLAVLLERLNLNKVYLCAHSMGASIATLFVNRYTALTEKVILTCNGIFEYDDKAFAAFHKFGAYVVKFRPPWLLKIPLADKIFIARFLYRAINKKDSIAFLEDFLLADYEAALGTIYTSVNERAVKIMPQEFAKVQVPTLMISGEKDKIIPAQMGKEAAQLNEKINYIEIPGTAHFPMLEDSPTYLKIVNEFLET
jgi:pimeloyl-ACP methyl ester carboxylesterase